jgi:hypothetical protein
VKSPDAVFKTGRAMKTTLEGRFPMQRLSQIGNSLQQIGRAFQTGTLYLLMISGGIASGAYCVRAAYQVGAGADIWLGISLAAVAVISWGMLPWADRRAADGARIEAQIWRLGWIGVLGVVVINGVTYSAHYRTEMTGGDQLKIERYDDAKRQLARAERQLADLKLDTRWQVTAACVRPQGVVQVRYCGEVKSASEAIASAAAIKALGRPGSADAGAETVAWATGLNEDAVRRSIPIGWALASDIIASLCLKSLLSQPKRRRELAAVKLEPVTMTAVEASHQPQAFATVNPAAKALADKRWANVRENKKKDRLRARA